MASFSHHHSGYSRLDDSSLRHLTDLKSELAKSKPSTMDAVFLQFCDSVVELLSRKLISPPHAAIQIASTMFIPGLDSDPLREEITMVAGQLEMPLDKHRAAELWQKLGDLLLELRSRTP